MNEFPKNIQAAPSSVRAMYLLSTRLHFLCKDHPALSRQPENRMQNGSARAKRRKHNLLTGHSFLPEKRMQNGSSQIGRGQSDDCFRDFLIILVELIVVLVILAILAAIMVPQLVGYIDKAKEKQLTITGRTVMLAGQSAADEAYGMNKTLDATLVKEFLKDEDLQKGSSWAISFTKYKVTKVEYTDGKAIVTYDGSEWKKTDGSKSDITAASTVTTEGTGVVAGDGPTA